MSQASTPASSLGARALIRSRSALWRTGEFGVVLLGPGMSDPITIAGPGPQLWELLRAARTEDEIVTELADVFSTDPGVVRRDVGPILRELVSIGLIESDR